MPVPGRGELLVRVSAVGLCGTDVKIKNGGKRPTPLPLVMGHEIAGVVAQRGPGVETPPVGSKGIVHFYRSCHRCDLCRDNRETLCGRMDGRLGFTLDGGLREYLTVPAENFIPVWRDARLEELCIAVDAISTPYRGLRRAGVRQGDRVLVVGLGGVGIHAVQLAGALGAEVVGVDVSEEKIEYAGQFGLKKALAARGSPAQIAARLKALAGGDFDIAVETVSRTETFEADLAALGPSGRVLVLGYGAPAAQIAPYALVQKEIAVLGSRAASASDVNEAVEMIRKGLVRPAVSRFFRLEEVNEALNRLERGDALGRQVVVF